jgi:predicted ribosome quality control (RQC) complex YloA/Tae2 family protein
MASDKLPQNPSPKAAAASRERSRAQLLDEVAKLAGASLQKIWLASPTLISLQLRTPGRSFIVAVDAERAMALVADERPSSPESALKSQATLRNVLAGARFDSATLIAPRDSHETTKQLSLRIELTTKDGKRALHADPRAHALVLSAIEADPKSGEDAERIIWAAPGAVATFRPGSQIAPWRLVIAEAAEPNASAETAAEETRSLATETLAAGVAERFAAEKTALVRSLKTKAQKLARTLEAVERDSEAAAKAVSARKFAELLLPQQSKIPRGARVAVVPDWSELDEEGKPAQISIALDPALGAAENASRMLKKAQRYAAAGPRIQSRVAEMRRLHEEAEALLARAWLAQDASELRSIGSLNPSTRRAQTTPQQRMKTERLPYRAFRASNGARILVGRSAKDNDTLTMKWARGDDLWLHARDIHGSHVILLDPGTAPDARALGEAALLAAHFSSARGADGAEVSWTRRKYVRKGKGQAPGAVTFSQEKSIRVRLDDALLQALLGREEP